MGHNGRSARKPSSGLVLTAGVPLLRQSVYKVPTSIAADCSVNVTAALQAWLDSLPDGATALLAAGGCYRVDGTPQLIDRNGLTIDGNGSTLRAFTDGPPERPRRSAAEDGTDGG